MKTKLKDAQKLKQEHLRLFNYPVYLNLNQVNQFVAEMKESS